MADEALTNFHDGVIGTMKQGPYNKLAVRFC